MLKNIAINGKRKRKQGKNNNENPFPKEHTISSNKDSKL